MDELGRDAADHASPGVPLARRFPDRHPGATSQRDHAVGADRGTLPSGRLGSYGHYVYVTSQPHRLSEPGPARSCVHN
jgi:hypothetical protein